MLLINAARTFKKWRSEKNCVRRIVTLLILTICAVLRLAMSWVPLPFPSMLITCPWPPECSTPVYHRILDRLYNTDLSGIQRDIEVFIEANQLTRSEQACIASDDDWPDLELFLPLDPSAKHFQEFATFVVPTMALFWPTANSKLVVITDGEGGSYKLQKYEQRLRKAVGKSIGKFRVVHNDEAVTWGGWYRQQRYKFWADNFTDSAFVGFIDSDTAFLSRVTKRDLFTDDGKPIVRPLFGKPTNEFWSISPQTTEWLLGHKEPFKCMAYFPIIFKVEHVRLMREHMLRQVGVATFDQLYRKMVENGNFAEFNLLCAYVWHFHRDQYYWVVTEVEPGWREFVPGQVGDAEQAGITEALFHRPSARIANHWQYESFPNVPGALKLVMAIGFCYSLTEKERQLLPIPSYCKSLNHSEINDFEWQFERIDYSIEPGSRESHQKRLADNDRCPHDWQPTALQFMASSGEWTYNELDRLFHNCKIVLSIVVALILAYVILVDVVPCFQNSKQQPSYSRI